MSEKSKKQEQPKTNTILFEGRDDVNGSHVVIKQTADGAVDVWIRNEEGSSAFTWGVKTRMALAFRMIFNTLVRPSDLDE